MHNPTDLKARHLLVLQLLTVAFEGESHEALEELFVWNAAGGPESGVDAGRGEAGDGVDLVYEQPLRFALEEEVDPGHAGGVYGLVSSSRHTPYLSCRFVGDICGDDELHRALGVLGLVVVELVVLHDDLPRNRDLGRFVAEHRYLNLPGVHSCLYYQAPVVLGGLFERSPQLSLVFCLVDADTRAQVRGLDEAGISKGALDLPNQSAPLILPLAAGEAQPLDLREAVVGEDLLHGQLVHPDGARQDPAPHVGDACELEHALDRAVLPVGPVQNWEDNVYGAKGCRYLLFRSRHGTGGSVGDLIPPRLQLAHGVVRGDPASLPGYAYGDYLVAPREGLHDGARRGKGDLVLPAPAAEDHHHPNQRAAPPLASAPILSEGALVFLKRPLAQGQGRRSSPSERLPRTLCARSGRRRAPRRPSLCLPGLRRPRSSSASSSCGRSLP